MAYGTIIVDSRDELAEIVPVHGRAGFIYGVDHHRLPRREFYVFDAMTTDWRGVAGTSSGRFEYYEKHAPVDLPHLCFGTRTVLSSLNQMKSKVAWDSDTVYVESVRSWYKYNEPKNCWERTTRESFPYLKHVNIYHPHSIVSADKTKIPTLGVASLGSVFVGTPLELLALNGGSDIGLMAWVRANGGMTYKWEGTMWRVDAPGKVRNPPDYLQPFSRAVDVHLSSTKTRAAMQGGFTPPKAPANPGQRITSVDGLSVALGEGTVDPHTVVKAISTEKDQMFCQCSSAKRKLVDNMAGGKPFKYCQTCKKEYR